MQPTEGPLPIGETAWMLPSHPPERRPLPTNTARSYSLEQYRSLLPGIIGKGHGIEALCFFLAISSEALFDLIVQCDLPIPHNRPLRRSSGARAWTQSNFDVLFDGWLNSWSAAYIGDRLGRSRGSIWYQARRLGLPRRDRKLLHWPEQTVAELPLPSAPKTGSAKKRLPPRWFVKGTDKVLELKSKRNGLEVDWAANIEAYVEIGWRIWSGQRISRIAEDYGVSYGTITSQTTWLQAKSPASHKDLVDHFDRARGVANAKAMGGELRRCEINQDFYYWKVGRKFKSRRDNRQGRGGGLGF